MARGTGFLAVSLLMVASVAGADFIVNNSALPPNKVNLNPLPIGANPAQYFQASDYNNLAQAALDLRNAVVNGAYHGLAAQTTDPLPSNATNYFYFKNDNTLHFKFGSTDSIISTSGVSIGNWVFSGNNADLTAAGVMGVGTSTATGVKIFPNAVTLGANPTFTPTSSSSGTTAIQWSPAVADGSSSVAFDINNTATLSGNNRQLFRVRNNATSEFQVTANGNISVPSGQGLYVLGSEGSFGLSVNSTNPVIQIVGGAISSTQYNASTLLISSTAPAISSGFGTGASVSSNNGTAGFRINVGTTSAATGVIGLPTATTGWNCFCTDLTTNSTSIFVCKQTASSTASATIGNFSDVAGAVAWADNNILAVSCFAF